MFNEGAKMVWSADVSIFLYFRLDNVKHIQVTCMFELTLYSVNAMCKY